MRCHRSFLVVAAVLVLAVAVARQVDPPAPDRASRTGGPVAVGVGRVLAVLDGDTLTVRLPDYEGPVRVVGIDTPEVEHPGRPAGCFGEQAAAATAAWLADRLVRVEPALQQRDRYDRLLARVEPLDGPIAGRDLARTLALSGFARELPIAPNTQDAPRIAADVRVARRHGRGLWTACGFAAAFPGKQDAADGR
jgi:micrococcal nuclease